MGEFRRDPVSGRWVIIASDRATRPTDFKNERAPRTGGFCPFCEGNEDKTPAEIAAYRAPGTQADRAGWSVRVVPNKFPALRVEGAIEKRGDGMYDIMSGVGAHEVIIEGPQHCVSITEMADPLIRDVLSMYRDRLLDLRKDARFSYGMVFKNSGVAAGATLEHSHSQLVVMPVVPRNVAVEMRCMREFMHYRDRCLICDMVAQELSQEARVVQRDEHFIAFAPFASRFPFEIWVTPRSHAAHFEDTSPDGLAALGSMLKACLAKLERALNMPPYNYIIHTAPFRRVEEDEFHWHIEIIPRIIHLAGFEWGTGFYINTVPPESAAQYLKDTDA